jgi:ADP-ribosylglycohydrolase
MRLAPVPVRWHADTALAADQSGESSRSTHPASRPVDACRLLGAMVADLIAGASFDQVTAPGFWTFGDLDPVVAGIVAGSWRDKQPPEICGNYLVSAISR